jgi:hypothetical protein
MGSKSVTTRNRTSALIPRIKATAPDDVRDVILLPNDRLAVRFYDGTAGIVDMAAMIASPSAGVFAKLRDPAIFTKVHTLCGVVTWPGEIDLAPDTMHKAIKATGAWVLTG